MPHRLILLFIFGASFALYSGHAAAEVRRCVTPGGQEVFTDRKCDEVGATESVPREQAKAAGAHVRAGGCMRTLQDLVFEMTTAIDAHDVNRLAGIYHWTGLSSEAGYQVLSRLDAIANRPLADIVPVMPNGPAPPRSQAIEAGNERGNESRTSNDADGPVAAVSTTPPASEAGDGNFYPQTSVRRTPVALRVEQTLGGSATPSQTVFSLLRHFDCWWVRL